LFQVTTVTSDAQTIGHSLVPPANTRRSWVSVVCDFFRFEQELISCPIIHLALRNKLSERTASRNQAVPDASSVEADVIPVATPAPTLDSPVSEAVIPIADITVDEITTTSTQSITPEANDLVPTPSSSPISGAPVPVTTTRLKRKWSETGMREECAFMEHVQRKKWNFDEVEIEADERTRDQSHREILPLQYRVSPGFLCDF
jgi:hypothetical protein